MPDPALPWEVVVPEPDGDAGNSLSLAWDGALRRARGSLIWPLGTTLPPLALIPAVLRHFDQPQTDLLQLSYTQGGIAQGLDQYCSSPAGTLVLQRHWLETMGGFQAFADLRALKQAALRIGACLQNLPLCLGEIDA